ncbi:hypothetical protein BJV77DRAFT_1024495 [Russula vinacea]|nr:hypothetical protein BJV77DRAFT_1024495 [Russula vinacea]
MTNNILSTEHTTEASDTVYDVELEELGRSDRSDLREDNRRNNDQQHNLPLGVELTGYRLFTTTVILGFGIPKAVYSYNGQSLISTTLDWTGGTLLAFM